MNEDDQKKPKRLDVGYCRPPVETRFKKGQKPPPRKKKPPPEVSLSDIIWRVLNERRRVEIDGKPTWMRNSELLTRRAYLEADRGSSLIGRLLIERQLAREAPPGETQPATIVYDAPPHGEFHLGTCVYRDEPPDD